jgi:hypothetical protein
MIFPLGMILQIFLECLEQQRGGGLPSRQSLGLYFSFLRFVWDIYLHRSRILADHFALILF